MKKLFYALLIVSSLNASANISKTTRTKSLLTEKIEKTFSKSLSKKDIKLAKEEVLKYKGKAVPALINIMKNEKFPDRNRWVATFLLGRVMGRKSIPFMTKFSKHPNWVMRLASYKSLLALGEKDPKIYSKGLKDPSLLVRFQSLDSVSRLNLTELAPTVWSMLYDKRNYYSSKKDNKKKRQHIVKSIVKTVGDLKFKKAEEPLLKMVLNKKYDDILKEMNYALSKITNKKAPVDDPVMIKRFWKKHQLAKMTF